MKKQWKNLLQLSFIRLFHKTHRYACVHTCMCVCLSGYILYTTVVYKTCKIENIIHFTVTLYRMLFSFESVYKCVKALSERSVPHILFILVLICVFEMNS